MCAWEPRLRSSCPLLIPKCPEGRASPAEALLSRQALLHAGAKAVQPTSGKGWRAARGPGQGPQCEGWLCPTLRCAHTRRLPHVHSTKLSCTQSSPAENSLGTRKGAQAAPDSVQYDHQPTPRLGEAAGDPHLPGHPLLLTCSLRRAVLCHRPSFFTKSGGSGGLIRTGPEPPNQSRAPPGRSRVWHQFSPAEECSLP